MHWGQAPCAPLVLHPQRPMPGLRAVFKKKNFEERRKRGTQRGLVALSRREMEQNGTPIWDSQPTGQEVAGLQWKEDLPVSPSFRDVNRRSGEEAAVRRQLMGRGELEVEEGLKGRCLKEVKSMSEPSG